MQSDHGSIDQSVIVIKFALEGTANIADILEFFRLFVSIFCLICYI